MEKALPAFLVLALAAGSFAGGTAAGRAQERAFDPVEDVRLEGWEPAAGPEVYEKTGLFGYIDGGAEIFLQYGFEAAVVLRFTREEAGPEIAIEICRMESPAGAFGIFSVKREGDERVSAFIEGVNWVGPGQASFVKGPYFVSLLGDRIAEGELEAAAAEVARLVPGGPAGAPGLLPAFEALPPAGRSDASLRYIRGNLAAVNESPLLEEAVWGFADGRARAYSAKYSPANAKTVLVDFGEPREDITVRVEELFREFLDGVARDGRVVRARNAAGRRFMFRQAGRWAALILGEPDPAAARARLDETLERAAALGESAAR